MELLLLMMLLLPVAIFLIGLLLADFVYRTGGTMEERKAVVFEVYRYSVCFLMVLVFAFMAFQLVSTMAVDMTNTQALLGPGIGVLLSGLLFLIHWLMKNPGEPKASRAPGKSSSENA